MSPRCNLAMTSSSIRTRHTPTADAEQVLQGCIEAIPPSVLACQTEPTTTTTTTSQSCPATAEAATSVLRGYKLKSWSYELERRLPYTLLHMATSKMNLVVDGLEQLCHEELSAYCVADNQESKLIKRRVALIVERRVTLQVKRHCPIGEQLALLEFVSKGFIRSRLESKK